MQIFQATEAKEQEAAPSTGRVTKAGETAVSKTKSQEEQALRKTKAEEKTEPKEEKSEQNNKF